MVVDQRVSHESSFLSILPIYVYIYIYICICNIYVYIYFFYQTVYLGTYLCMIPMDRYCIYIYIYSSHVYLPYKNKTVVGSKSAMVAGTSRPGPSLWRSLSTCEAGLGRLVLNPVGNNGDGCLVPAEMFFIRWDCCLLQHLWRTNPDGDDERTWHCVYLKWTTIVLWKMDHL